jgi:hypothetical protein
MDPVFAVPAHVETHLHQTSLHAQHKSCENVIRQPECLFFFYGTVGQYSTEPALPRAYESCLCTSGNTYWAGYGIRTFDRSVLATERSNRLKKQK